MRTRIECRVRRLEGAVGAARGQEAGVERTARAIFGSFFGIEGEELDREVAAFMCRTREFGGSLVGRLVAEAERDGWPPRGLYDPWPPVPLADGRNEQDKPRCP